MPEPRPARQLAPVPFTWHAARWRHVEPGPRGLILLGLLSLALLIPLERVGVGIAWTSQVRSLVTLGIFAASALFGRASALSDDAEHWLIHLGKSPAAWALERWGANLLALAGLSLLWTAEVLAVSTLAGTPIAWSGLLGLCVQLIGSGIVVTIVLLCAGALGVQQTTEVAVLLLLATVTIPLAVDRVPEIVLQPARAILPPLLTVGTLRAALVDGHWRTAATAALQIASWCTVAMALAVHRLTRRLPR